MLTKQNSGKYLSNQWQNERTNTIEDGYISGDFSREELELTDVQIGGRFNPDTYTVKTTPIDAFTESSEYDMRNNTKIDG